jgi:hypothetical protein
MNLSATSSISFALIFIFAAEQIHIHIVGMQAEI